MKLLVRNDRKDSTAHSYEGPIFDSNRKCNFDILEYFVHKGLFINYRFLLSSD